MTKDRKYILITSDKETEKLFEELEIDGNEVIMNAFIYCFNKKDKDEYYEWAKNFKKTNLGQHIYTTP